MTTTAVPDRGPVSVFSSMMGVGRLLSRCSVYMGTSLQHHPYIGEVTVTKVTTEGTQASTAKIPIATNKMTPVTFTVQAAVSEIDVELPGFRPALDEAIIKALTNTVEQHIASTVHSGAGAAVTLSAPGNFYAFLGSWIAKGDQVDTDDALWIVGRAQASDFLADFPVQERGLDIHEGFGIPIWFGSGLGSGDGLICNPKDIHVVFYGEPKVIYNPYGNPLLHSATGIAHVGVELMGNTAQKFGSS